MEDPSRHDLTIDEPAVYQIRLKGHLGDQWIEWFDGLSISLEDNGDTVLTGPVADQCALHGLLRAVRDLGVPLLAVRRVDRPPPEGRVRSSE